MQPIYIEVSDEITTVIERMKGTPASSIALVIPKGAILLQSIVNLKLAKKAAADNQKDLVLVTTDKIGRNLAAQVGLKVISRLDGDLNETEENTDPTDNEAEPHIIAGVKVHRYYQDGQDEKAEPETEDAHEPGPEPIVPRQIFQDKSPDPLPAATSPDLAADSPIVIPEKPVVEEPTETIEKITLPAMVEIIPPLAQREAAKRANSTITRSLIPGASEAAEPLSPAARARRRKVILSLLYLCILGLIAATAVSAFYLPQTTVVITVKPESWNAILPLTATLNPSDPQNVAAELITAQTSDNFTMNATGSKDIGSKATGAAKISYIDSSLPQTLPAGATLTANGQSFITTAAVTVPGAQVQNGVPVAGSAVVSIEAIQAGDAGNLSNIPATVNQGKFYGLIVSTNGGSSKKLAVISQTDISNAKQQVSKHLQDAGKAKLADQLKNRSVLSNEATDSFNLDSFTTSLPVDSEAETFQVTGKATSKRLIVDKNLINAAALKQLSTQHSLDKDHTYLVDKLEIGQAELNTANQTAHFVVNTNGRVSQAVPLDSIRSQLTSKPEKDGRDLINLIVKNPSVTISRQPDWWPIKNFPYFPKYLKVLVHYE